MVEIVDVEVYLAEGEVNSFIIPRCPLCDRVHKHGAGGYGDDPILFQGHRSPHCENHVSGVDYCLVWNNKYWPDDYKGELHRGDSWAKKEGKRKKSKK